MAVNILYRINSSAQKPQITSINPGSLTSEQFDGNLRSIKDAIDVIETAYLPLAGGILTGRLTLNGDASNELEPVTYRQLQSTVSPPATISTLGTVKVGNGLSIDGDGVLSVGSSVSFTDQYFTPTADNTFNFQPVGGYETGKIELYINGLLQYPGYDYTASDDTNIVMVDSKPISTTDKLLIRKWKSPTNTLFVEQTFEPQSPTAQFAVTGDYTPGAVTVYLNGILLLGSGDGFVANTGRTVDTTIPITSGDNLLVRKWITDFVHPFNEIVVIPSDANVNSVTVPGGYIPGTIEVYLNGVLLYGDGDNYRAADGRTIIDMSTAVGPLDRLLVRRWSMWAI